MDHTVTMYDASSPVMSRRFADGSTQIENWAWNDLMETSISYPIKVASRYSAAGIDPHTIIVGQVIGGNFKLSNSGFNRLRKAIMELSSISATGNAIHFGFGADSFVRNLSATEEGGVLIALCAATLDTFETQHSASIMMELASAFKPSARYLPSRSQWMSLLNACAGTLAATDLPCTIEYLLHIHPHTDELFMDDHEKELYPRTRGLSSPDTMAKALLAIGGVSTGKYESVCISGGGDAGWLAAVALWLFDVKVAVMNSAGDILHTNVKEGEHTQVKIIYVNHFDNAGVVNFPPAARSIFLRDITQKGRRREKMFLPIFVCGRIPWNIALSRTFGPAFARLMQMQRHVGLAIAAAARAFDDISRADPRSPNDTHVDCQTYFAHGKGRGLITFAVSLLSELEPLTPYMQSEYPPSFEAAKETYSSSISHLKTNCKCSLCTEKSGEDTYIDRICLVFLLEAIILLLRHLSGISNPLSLMPIRSGIEWFYFYRTLIQGHIDSTEVHSQKYNPFSAILELQRTDSSIRRGVITGIRRLRAAVRLFFAHPIAPIQDNHVAVGGFGGVAFLNTVLEGGLTIDPELVGMCTILPGHIEMNGHCHRIVRDMNCFCRIGLTLRRRATKRTNEGPIDDPSRHKDVYSKVRLVAEERFDVIHVGFSVADSTTRQAMMLGPAALTLDILNSIGLVHCDHRKQAGEITERQTRLNDEVCLLQHEGERPIYNFVGSVLGRMIALYHAREVHVTDDEPTYLTILRQDECLDCCKKAADFSKFAKAFIFSSKSRLPQKRSRDD